MPLNMRLYVMFVKNLIMTYTDLRQLSHREIITRLITETDFNSIRLLTTSLVWVYIVTINPFKSLDQLYILCH